MRSTHHVKHLCNRVSELFRGGLFVPITLAIFGLVTAPAFAGDVGALVEFQPQTPARAAEVNQNFQDVKDAVNSKTSSGIEFASSDSSLPVGDQAATPTVALSVTVSAPAAGFVEVEFDAYLAINHSQGSGVSYAVCAIKTDTSSVESATNRLQGSRRFVPVLSGSESGTHYPHISTAGVHTLPAAGSVTFNVVCYRNSNASSATLIYRSLRATYHSDRY